MNKLHKNQIILVTANMLLVFFAIALSNLQILPLRLGDFIFFAILTLALALYRPGWGFLFFVGTIMLENINLAPAELGISVRPYQFFGGLTILAILIRLATKRLNFKLIKITWYDWLVIMLGISSFVSAIFAENRSASFKQSVILVSFICLYFLVRNYLQTLDDVKKIIPFFLSSSAVVVLYGIWQNIQFMRGASHFEVMAGRPNATFTEADWLGIYLILLVAVIYGLIFYFNKKGEINNNAQISNSEFLISNQIPISKIQIIKGALFILLVLTFIVLILTVSRSAWLGAFGVTSIFLLTVFMQLKISYKNWQWREMIWMKVKIISAILVSIAIVYFFHLTNFQLANRVQSTGGLQKITISCQDEELSPHKGDLVPTEDLEKINCRHINLEEIENEKSAGNFLTEVYRKDPNVDVRAKIYVKSWNLIKQNPIIGIGWGDVGAQLGIDERGTGLNASNIFLEIWLGAGLIGLVSFLAIWFWILGKSARDFFLSKTKNKILPLCILLAWFALTIPNLFNAGIMLGFLWVFLGVAFISNDKIIKN